MVSYHKNATDFMSSHRMFHMFLHPKGYFVENQFDNSFTRKYYEFINLTYYMQFSLLKYF